jgi:hypothetical protein
MSGNVSNGETVVAEDDITVKLEVKNRPRQDKHYSGAASSQEESEPEPEDGSR